MQLERQSAPGGGRHRRHRLTMLLAVAHRHAGLQLQGQDVFANVVGGVRWRRLPEILAIVMAARRACGPAGSNSLIAFGELGWRARFAPVPFGEERLREAAKHGSNQRWFPKANVPKRFRREVGSRSDALNQALEAF